jgi:hypothetical protein
MKGGRFAVYCSTLGNYYYREFRSLLAHGLRALGARAVETDERGGFRAGVDWHLIVAPHDFFYLGGAGALLRRAPWPAGVVLFNSEAPEGDMFPFVRRLLPRAHAVWDLDLAGARRLAREGWRASRVPLGWAAGGGLFVENPPPLAERPIDVLFVGCRSPRRDAFFAAAEPWLSRYRSVVRLSENHPFARRSRTRGFLELARSSKIVLNVHRGEARYFEWHRAAVHGLAQGAFVLSEPSNAAPPLTAGRDYAEVALDEMPATVERLLGSARGLSEAQRVASSGLRSFRISCRIEKFLSEAVKNLGAPASPAARRARGRDETAAALYRTAR